MPVPDPAAGLLADLDTITDVARAGVISRREVRLEPGETRLAAILYIDVVGFTELARLLDPESLGKLIDRTFRIYELSVNGQGGYLDKVVGDAALYVFPGHPNHPPACEAALRASLMLLDRTRQICESLKETGLRIAIRCGVAFGEVARLAVGGKDVQMTVMGETVNVAQRLEATAEPGTVQTTCRVLEKAGDALLSSACVSQELNGIGPVATYRVTGVQPQAVHLRGSFARLSPFIGRDEVLREAAQQVTQWWRTDYGRETWDISASPRLAGRNRLLLIRGDTAVGKSRLAYELREHLRGKAAESPGGTLPAGTAHCTANASLHVFTAELARVAGVDEDNLPGRWEELCARAAEAVSVEYAERQRRHLPGWLHRQVRVRLRRRVGLAELRFGRHADA